ncbi:hypothetical protein BLOT_005728 [Blomia tropicalis]|nr:hypothetical protein BLOT_005728 [Blomia tropicalis]
MNYSIVVCIYSVFLLSIVSHIFGTNGLYSNYYNHRLPQSSPPYSPRSQITPVTSYFNRYGNRREINRQIIQSESINPIYGRQSPSNVLYRTGSRQDINFFRNQSNSGFISNNPVYGSQSPSGVSYGSGFIDQSELTSSKPSYGGQVESDIFHELPVQRFNYNQCKSSATCQHHHTCRDRQIRSNNLPSKLCTMPNGYTGICCDSQQSTRFHGYLDESRIEIDLNEVKQSVDELAKFEYQLAKNKIRVKTSSSAFFQQAFSGGNDVTLVEAKNAFSALVAFQNFVRRKKLSVSDILETQLQIARTNLGASCLPKPTCVVNAVYRMPDGSCNNLQKTAQGKAISTFGRLLPADYADGIGKPRIAFDGTELPNPRLISLSIAPDNQNGNNQYTLLMMQFGQFVDHDLTRTPLTTTLKGRSISCCDNVVQRNPERFKHPACHEIEIPVQDAFYRSKKQTCINFVRSAPAINPVCRFGPREQMNQLSSYIDGNNVYGASLEEEQKLRDYRGGRLRISKIHSQEFLPLNPNDTSCQLPRDSPMKCFLGGDGRANEVTDLTILHTLWLREHNRIARKLARMNPAWNDEAVYQETKRIVIAEMQHIIYNEFLPMLLGPRAMSHFKLSLSNQHTKSYNPEIDATIVNEFAAAAFRLHTLVPGWLNFHDVTKADKIQGQVLLRNQFFQPELLYHEGGYDMRISSLTSQPTQTFDNFFSTELTNHLFQTPGQKFGLDLVALNIQRGRDHGLPGYVKYRELCGLARPKSINDLKKVFSNAHVAEVVTQMYRSLDDIDLFVGGTSERHMDGAVVGPTFACIIGEQFRRIKRGDRFWYENADQIGSFTELQLDEIKKSTLARVLCDNSAVDYMQPQAMLMASQRNPKVKCDSIHIPRVDLSPWAGYR